MQHQKIEIRVAGDVQAPALIALMPEIARASALELLGAWHGDRLVGAGAISWATGPRHRGFSVWMHVRAEWRRRGIGRALADAIRARTQDETDGLWTAARVDDDSGEAAFLRACGYEAREQQFEFLFDEPVFVGGSLAMEERMRAGGHIPATAQAMALRAAPFAAVAALLARELGSDRTAVERGLDASARGQGAYDLDSSSAVLVDGEVAGVLLASRRPGTWLIDAVVVAAKWRNRWVQPLLFAESARRGGGVLPTVTYVCDADNRMPVKFAQRLGATRTSTRSFFYQALASAG